MRLIRWVPAVAATLALSACGGGPESVADDNTAFADCLDGVGASAEGGDDWDEAQAREFWTRAGTLDCAIDELDADARREALESAFPDDDNGSGGLTAQWAVVASWATTSGGAAPVEDVVNRAVTLLSDTWVSEADVPTATGITSAAVLGAMRGAGELGSYDAYLRDHPDAEDTADLLVGFGVGDNIDEAAKRRSVDLTDAAVDQIRD